MERRTKFVCYIAHYPATYKQGRLIDDVLGENNYNELIDEISSSGSYILDYSLYGKPCQLLISVGDDSEILKQFPDQVFIGHKPINYLRIETTISDLTTESEDDIKRNVILSDSQMIDDFRAIMRTFFVAVNIAYLGSVVIRRTNEVIVKQNNAPLKWNIDLIFGQCFNHIINFSYKKTWPKMQNQKLSKVWQWLNNFPDTFTGFSEGQIGRVINALKYIGEQKYNGHDGSIMNSTWAIVCLEVLYLRDVNDKSKISEIKKRIVATLGTMPKDSSFSTKKLGDLYTFRSNFLHGDADFPAPSYSHIHALRDRRKLYYKYIRELIDVTISVEVIVLATLQVIIANNWQGLEFDIQYTPISPKK
jgi:hypothetical protein